MPRQALVAVMRYASGERFDVVTPDGEQGDAPVVTPLGELAEQRQGNLRYFAAAFGDSGPVSGRQ